jgi:glutamate decarboxylase
MKRRRGFNEFDVSNKVREKGWLYPMPPNAQEVRSLRVVVRLHINHNVVQTLWHDIISACKYLEEHGAATPPKPHAHSTPAKC